MSNAPQNGNGRQFRPDGKEPLRAPAVVSSDTLHGDGRLAELLARVQHRFQPWLATVLRFRTLILTAVHAVVFLTAYWLAFQLRFDFDISAEFQRILWRDAPWVLLLKLAVFYAAGYYHGWWRFVTFADLMALVRAAAIALFALIAANYYLLPAPIPRAVVLIDCVLSIILLGGLRAGWRFGLEHVLPLLHPSGCRRALLVGVSHSNMLLAHQIHSHVQLRYRIRGFLSVDASSHSSRRSHIPVLGSVEQVRAVAARYRITDVLLTAGALPGKQLRRLLEDCEQAKVTLKIIPPAEDLFNGDHRIPMRDIEISDLLRREPVTLDSKAIAKLIEGKVVLVTGAGGSIGSEICRQVMKFKPSALVLLGRGENRIYSIHRELAAAGVAVPIHACIADINDVPRMQRLFERHRPQVVFHAAAHKHVPLMEENPGEAVKNNIGGTRRLADLADACGVESFVMVSTDKAVHPTSVMGVCKHIAERYVHTLSEESHTRFMVVRFGNVLGSAGSVVPLFQEQIRRGGPITITDPRMVRFFMTIPEASQLVLQAATMGRGGEIFTLDMGEPVRIVDLARDLIRLSGLPPDSIDISFSGIRPGEKLYEELSFDDEQTLPTAHPKVQIAYHRPYSLAEVQKAIEELERLANADAAVIRAKLREVVVEYSDHSSRPIAAAIEPAETEPAPVLKLPSR